MRREELRAAIDRDPEAIVELVMTLSASVAALRAEVDELKRQLGRDSRNSSLPPSRDSPAARAKRPKKGSGRKQGGQPGHPGSHRELVADPDHVVEHCRAAASASSSWCWCVWWIAVPARAPSPR